MGLALQVSRYMHKSVCPQCGYFKELYRMHDDTLCVECLVTS